MPEVLDDLLAKIRQKFSVQFEPLVVDDFTLEVLTIENMTEHIDNMLRFNRIKNPLKDLPLWAKIWPGSMILGRLLRKYEPSGKTLLELGAGLATLSLIAQKYGLAKIIATDINPDALLMARANVLHNHLEDKIEVKYLDVQGKNDANANWPRFDFIAASELLYLEELHRPLVKFLTKHLNPNGLGLFCTDHARQKPNFAKLAQQNFDIQEGHIGVKTNSDSGEPKRHIYDILLLRPKIQANPK